MYTQSAFKCVVKSSHLSCMGGLSLSLSLLPPLSLTLSLTLSLPLSPPLSLPLPLSLSLSRGARTEESQLQQDRAIQCTYSFPSLPLSLLLSHSLSLCLSLCLSSLGNPDCPPRRKPAATGLRYSVY